MLPAPIGPYRICVTFERLLFISGQIGIIPETNEPVAGGIEEQTRQALTNLEAVLKENGSGLEKVLKTTIFLVQMKDFAAVNKIYAEFFTKDFPARSTVAVKELPKGALIEIEAIAVR